MLLRFVCTIDTQRGGRIDLQALDRDFAAAAHADGDSIRARRTAAIAASWPRHGRRITGRRPPPRRLRLSYLLTAWTQRPEDEHRLLSALLQGFLRSDELPEELLEGSLADAPVPTLTTLALPPTQDRSISDVWSALGGELKASIDLVVIAPLMPERAFETGPPVERAPLFRLSRDDLEEELVEERQGRS